MLAACFLVLVDFRVFWACIRSRLQVFRMFCGSFARFRSAGLFPVPVPVADPLRGSGSIALHCIIVLVMHSNISRFTAFCAFMLYFYHCAIILHSIGIILACAAFYRVACCQFLRVYSRLLSSCRALRLHVLQLVYNQLFRVSRQLQNVRLYNYHDDIKMHSRRVCFRLVAFPRFSWCKVFGSLQAGNVMWCA